MYILTKVSDILHSVFSSYKEKVLPWFEQLLQLIVQLIVSRRVHYVLDSSLDQQYLNPPCSSSVSQQAVGRQAVGSVHLRRRGGALQPLLLQIRRVLPATDGAVTGRHEPRGPAGGRLRRRRHGSVWRRELPPVLHRYVRESLTETSSLVPFFLVDI